MKVRDSRINLAEIEAVLRREPGVTDCAVVERESASGGKEVVAYVSGDMDARELHTHLLHTLPQSDCPSSLFVVERLPRTTSGALDHDALAATSSTMIEALDAAPRNALEKSLASIWAEVLQVERVGIHDDFFALGGHSLLATRLVGRVREAVGVDLPLRDLWTAPTVSSMADLVEMLRELDELSGAEVESLLAAEVDWTEPNWLKSRLEQYHIESSRLALIADLDVVSVDVVTKLLGALDRVHRAWGGGGLELESIEVGSTEDAGVCA